MREGRGISLKQIAAATKVDVELWSAMERNDFSRWPSGIFARAFVREYARLIAADPEETVNEFCRSFSRGDRRRGRIIREKAELLGFESQWRDDLAARLPEDRRQSLNSRETTYARPRVQRPWPWRMWVSVAAFAAMAVLRRRRPASNPAAIK
jgi:hypothetical protein